MHKREKDKIEFRYYETPQNEPLLALLGDKWKIEYGKDVDYLHFHNLFEIGYCYYGNGDLILESDVYRFSGGMFTTIPKNYPHTTNSDVGTIGFWEYLFVDAEGFLMEYYKDDPIFAQNLHKKINKKPCIMQESENPRQAALLQEIIEEMREKKTLYKDIVSGLLLAFLLEVARMNTEKPTMAKAEKASKSQITKALEYVSDHFYEPLRIEDLAGVCHMSETHFRRVFDISMNMTPVEYINMVRIQMACSYMLKTNDSMSTIASKVGFQTSSTFNRNFKKIVGLSPYHWKNNADNFEGKLHNFKISAHKGW
ncbi:MAG: AraC family transcriptional regulator [Mobilitalea sp.]